MVQIAKRDVLEDFIGTWKLHHKLEPQQLDYAGRTGKIKSVSFYHGGYELYQMRRHSGNMARTTPENLYLVFLTIVFLSV